MASKFRSRRWREKRLGRKPRFFQFVAFSSRIAPAEGVTIERWQRLLRDIFDHTKKGGAFILVEKVLGSTAALDELFVGRYLGSKAEAGYSADDIARKKAALEGVLVPVTASWNEDLLRGAGFREIDCFWRSLNFAGWIAIKQEGRDRAR